MSAAAAGSFGSRITRFFLHPHYPRDVLEISPDRCTAASVQSRNGRILIHAAESEALIPGTVDPQFSQKNMVSEEAVAGVCARVLKRAGIEPGPLTLLIPEGSVKVTLLDDFETLPSESAHVREMIVHKLKRILPFPPAETAVSWQTIRRAPKPIVLSVVMHQGILSQYHGLIRKLGYQPGCIDIPTFNLLTALEGSLRAFTPQDSVLVFNLDCSYLSQVLLSGHEPVLFRTKSRNMTAETPETRIDIAVADLLSTVRYFEDRVASGRRLSAVILRDTTGSLMELRARIASELPCRVVVAEVAGLVNENRETNAAQILMPLIGAALR